MRTILLGLGAVGLLACGVPGTTDGGVTDAGAEDAGVVNVSLAGARTATLVATGLVANFNVMPNRGEVSLVANSSTEETYFAFFFDGPPTAGTVVGNDAGVDCTIRVIVPGPSLDGWLANRGSGLPDLGTCSLVLSAVALKTDVTTQRRYTIHGTVGGTLPARSGAATGSITYSASF